MYITIAHGLYTCFKDVYFDYFFYSIVAELRCECKLMNPNKYILRNIPDQREKLLNSQVEK